MGTYDRLILLYMYWIINCLCLLHLCMHTFFLSCVWLPLNQSFVGNSYENKHVYFSIRLVTLARFRTRYHKISMETVGHTKHPEIKDCNFCENDIGND